MSPEELLKKLEANVPVQIDGWYISKTDCSFGPIIETVNPYGVGGGTTSMTLVDCKNVLDRVEQSKVADAEFA